MIYLIINSSLNILILYNFNNCKIIENKTSNMKMEFLVLNIFIKKI